MIHTPATQAAKKPTGVNIAIAIEMPVQPSHTGRSRLRIAISDPASTSVAMPVVNSRNVSAPSALSAWAAERSRSRA